MASYGPAPEVQDIAESLIAEHHNHLAMAKIAYVFVDPPMKSKGDIVLGKVSKVSAKANALIRMGSTEVFAEDENAFDFVMEISEEPWGDLSGNIRKALIDHELMHAWWTWDLITEVDPVTDKVVAVHKEFKAWTVRNHEVEEFVDIVGRHGLWNEQLKEFNEACDELGKVLTLKTAAA